MPGEDGPGVSGGVAEGEHGNAEGGEDDRVEQAAEEVSGGHGDGNDLPGREVAGQPREEDVPTAASSAIPPVSPAATNMSTPPTVSMPYLPLPGDLRRPAGRGV